MMKFLKDNIAIVAAIALPALLALAFFLSTLVTTAVVEDPKHDFLIATNYYGNDNDALRLDVVQNKLVVTYHPPVRDENRPYYNQNTGTRLWRVHVPGMAIEEIAMPLPPDAPDGDGKAVTLDIPAAKDLTLAAIQPGPDGYGYDFSSRHYGGNLMMELFDYDHDRSGAVIEKDGRVIPLRAFPDGNTYYQPRFIGWITDEE